jgi:hypothetical protein
MGSEKQISNRHPGMFRPGVSGNPRGRPKRGASLAERIRETVDPNELIEFLLTTMRSPGVNRRERVAACQALFDRGWGKPLQSIELDASLSNEPAHAGVQARLRHVSDEALEQALALLTGGTAAPVAATAALAAGPPRYALGAGEPSE